ncbi:hypothetical protein QTP88_011091 [Uroleucon formosanum]
MDSTNEQPTDNTAEINADKINLPPPIFIQAQLNFNTFCIKLKEITDSTSFTCKTTTKGVKLQTFSSDSYRSVIKFLKNENVSFHSYQSKESKPLRVVIRNLHPSTDKDYIIKELSELGFQVINITNVLQKSTKTTLPLFFINLVQSQSNQEIFKLNSLCYSKVKVEAPYTKKEIPQCQRCPSYGHTRGYCNHTPRFVRSGDTHDSSECQKSRTEPAKCALCGGSHPANYRGCQSHKDILKHRKLISNSNSNFRTSHTHTDNNRYRNDIRNSSHPEKLPQYPRLRSTQSRSPDGSAHGGTVLLVSRRIPHSPFPHHSSDKLQIIATSIILNSIPISFVSAYLPSGCQFPKNELTSFILSLKHTFVIGADFNAKHLNWGSRYTNTRGRSLLRVMFSSHAKTITTDAPTYWPTHANRHLEILDFFLSNLPNYLKTQATNLNDPTSNHTPVLLQINTQAPSKLSFKQINWPKFRNILSNNTDLNIKLKTKEDIDLAITSLSENILLAKNNSLSPTLNTIKSNHITPEISQLIIEKRRARNKWQHSHYPDDRHIYDSLSNKLKKLFKKHKNVLYESHLSSLSPNNGSLWRKTKSLLRHKTIFPPLQRQNCNLAVSAQDEAELLAQHFSNVFKPHSILPDNSHLDQVNKYINSPLSMSLPAKHTTPNEISSIIKSLKIHKSPGHDQISNKIVKNFPAKTIIQLTHIYNATLRLSYFPSTWKSAVIIPILKPSKPPDKADSYRPISLLPVLGKILEKILLKRLLKISNEQNALPDLQFGFRPKHATFHQLHRVVDFIASSLETKKYCSAVFLDVTQAFDSVWHIGLLYKLKKIFPAPYYLLRKSYIENRSFNVKIESFPTLTIYSLAYPKGSDIAPFLYIIFTVDIPTTENTTMGTYADDTVILAADSDPDICSHHLQNHLNMLSKWCNTWKIKVNELKSTHITFTLRPKNYPEVFFNNSVILHSREAKYLRLLLDRRLTWGPHLKNKRKQLNSRLHVIRPLVKSNMNLSNRLLIYKSLLQPIWSYGIALWGTAKPSNLRTIQAFQSICLRMAAKAPWYVTNAALHQDLKVQPINQTAITFYSRLHRKM